MMITAALLPLSDASSSSLSPPLEDEQDGLSLELSRHQNQAEAAATTGEALVEVSTPLLLLSTVPLFGIAFVSWTMGLQLESPIVVGIIRTFVQLTVLGAILRPIFRWGMHLWWVVLLYILVVTVLASLEASHRSKYYFEGLPSCILIAFLINISLVCVFAFGIIIQPSPVWNPQYVIPIVGMLLGNCINGVALSLNAALTSLVEDSNEVELLLSFGASRQEATARLMREAVRVGAMPMLNSMAVIGLISIPGMMTGQILGGSPVMEAARYQMLIIYLIGMCAFGTILAEVWVACRVGFDHHSQMLRTDRFIKRQVEMNFLDQIAAVINAICSWICGCILRRRRKTIDNNSSSNQTTDGGCDNTAAETAPLTVSPLSSAESLPSEHYVALHQQGNLEVSTVRSGSFYYDNTLGPPNLDVRNVSRTVVEKNDANRSGGSRSRSRSRTLFRNLSFSVQVGGIAVVRGRSGVGKSQLLRLIAGLSPMDKGGDILLSGKSHSEFSNPANWRRLVRYVGQHKIQIPGTPRQFIKRVTSFQSWRHQDMPSFDNMVVVSTQLVQSWGLEPNCLDKEWKLLSGGEAQRVHVAIAIASRPRVILNDESTNQLDHDSKMRVEQSIEMSASEHGVSVLWVTHDEEQAQRIGTLSIWNQSLGDATSQQLSPDQRLKW